MKATEPLMRLR